MTNIRLLPIVIMAVAALLVLKTVGLFTSGGYVLTGVATAQAAGGGEAPSAAASAEPVTIPSEPTIADQTPTLSDGAPTLGAAPASTGGGHGSAPAEEGHGTVAETEGHSAPEVANVIAAENACDPRPIASQGAEGAADGELVVIAGDCPPLGDALPQLAVGGEVVSMSAAAGSATEQALLERLAARRAELEAYEQQLTMRASLVEAAEKRIEERQTALQSIEDQIASLVEQRKQMEEGQFASIVAMYETMKPNDAAKIFDNLDMDVLLRVSKMMSPRKMAPILAEMNTTRAQELTVRMASASADPLETMTPDDLAALPQIIGQ